VVDELPALERLRERDLPTETKKLARALIGCVLVREEAEGRAAGIIVETEAYVPGDPASHAWLGERPRNGSMFLDPFHAYVYQIYGTSFCFNVSSEARGKGAAVLVRALEPLAGTPIMQRRRGRMLERDLCRGPGRLCRALAIDRSLDGAALLTSEALWLGRPVRAWRRVGTSRRIGITKAAHRLLRFYERGSIYVSGPRALSPP
jgi:DNA-3-methyladenine glycosylase